MRRSQALTSDYPSQCLNWRSICSTRPSCRLRSAHATGAEGRMRSSATCPWAMNSLCVLGGTIGVRQLLLVFRRELGRLDRDRQPVELAGEREGGLVIAI